MESIKPHILVLTNAYPTADTPNKGLDIREQLRRLTTFFEFKVIYARPKIGKVTCSRANAKQWYDQKIQIFETAYPTIPKIGPLINGMTYYISIRKLISSINKIFPLNLVSCYWTYPEGLAASFISKKMNIPLAIRPRGSDINFFKQYLPFRLLIKYVLRKANAIIPVCKDLGKNIVDLGINQRKVHCIPFGVDTLRFKHMDKLSCRKKIGIKSESKALLFIGNLVDVKGIDYLLESLEILENKKIENIELNIIGSGILREKYLNGAKRFKACRIKFRGEIPNHEIPIWMNASDLFCLPSISEGYPNVLMEALACGLPVVATSVGGIPEIIDSADVGILVSPRNPVELSEALLTAMEQKWNAGLLIERGMNNDWKTSSNRIYKIYKELTD